MRHGLLARCLVLQDESPKAFQSLLDIYVARLQPADELELDVVEEMVAAAWRLRRNWAIETRMMDTLPADAVSLADTDSVGRITTAFKSLAASPVLPLMHRYETRLHMMYQRALHNLLLLRAVIPNEPSPISEHSTERHSTEIDPC